MVLYTSTVRKKECNCQVSTCSKMLYLLCGKCTIIPPFSKSVYPWTKCGTLFLGSASHTNTTHIRFPNQVHSYLLTSSISSVLSLNVASTGLVLSNTIYKTKERWMQLLRSTCELHFRKQTDKCKDIEINVWQNNLQSDTLPLT